MRALVRAAPLLRLGLRNLRSSVFRDLGRATRRLGPSALGGYDAPGMATPEERSRGAKQAPTALARMPRLGLLAGGFVLGLLAASTLRCGRSTTSDAPQAPSEVGEQRWTCSMHPQIRQGEPGHCSLCGMDLVVADSSQGQEDPRSLRYSKRAQTLARLRTTEVRARPGATAQLRMSGRLRTDTDKDRSISTWAQGWVEELRIREIGDEVVASDDVARLYNPALRELHAELLAAKQRFDRLPVTRVAARRSAQKELDKLRDRFKIVGASEEDIVWLEAEERPSRSLVIRSPFSGTMTKRLVDSGAYVSAGTALYVISDLSSLWLMLDAHEMDLPRLALGQHATLSVDAFPGELFHGLVTYINPNVDPIRRSAQVRVQVNNLGRRLRPGMFVRAVITPQLAQEKRGSLVVPVSAPLLTGKRAVVFLEHHDEGGYRYEARPIQLGARFGDVYSVVSGLRAGDRVVSHGAFALDADLQIRGGLGMMAQTGDAQRDPRVEIVDLGDAERKKLAMVYHAYVEIQAALAGDSFERVTHSADSLRRAIQEVDFKAIPKAHSLWKDSRNLLLKAAQGLSKAKNLSEARTEFLPLSQCLIRVTARHANPLPYGLRLAYCPMAFNDRGAYWLQKGDVVNNPYFGSEMLTCGEIRQRLGAQDFLMPPADLDRGSAPQESTD